jgi:ABC-type Fe3+-hydroxamate transport system substrate-binding protein
VCLVPSLTESLFALGLGGKVVGVTDYCVHPARELAATPRVGGTKTPDLGAVIALAPDLVIANREENRRRDVERLRAAGLRVWVTYPRTVREGAGLLAELAALGASPEAVDRVVEPVRRAVEEAEAARRDAGPRVFCPIWRRPWMAVGGDTYAHDLIALCGGRNVFGACADRRYPRVREEEIVAAAPELILLPDEPYAFGPQDAAELRAWPVPAARSGRIHLIDGTLVSWYGARISRAIATLRSLFEGG